jgi:hypothetical protein
MEDVNDLLDPSAAARILGISERALESWRKPPRRGPRFIRCTSKTIRYRRGDIQEFIRAREVSPQTEAASGRA